MNAQFELITETFDPVIRDTANQINFLFVATCGLGTPTAYLRLAQRVVDFLNSLPPEERLLLRAQASESTQVICPSRASAQKSENSAPCSSAAHVALDSAPLPTRAELLEQQKQLVAVFSPE